MNYRYHIQHSEETYHHFFRVRRYQVAYESFRGGMLENIERECLGGGHHVVAALPYDPVREKIILVEQFRIGAMVAGENPWQYEIVAGFMDADDPSPEASIQRELEEEIGTRALRLEPLMNYLGSPAPTSTSPKSTAAASSPTPASWTKAKTSPSTACPTPPPLTGWLKAN